MAAEREQQGLLDALRAALLRNETIRSKLPGGGRIHIDRQQPFLCVYRYPPDRPDPGTDRLLLGQAAYLLAPGDPGQVARLRQLLKVLTEPLVAAFGAALVVELWAEEVATEPPEAANGITAALRIVAPDREAPLRTLETLDRAILAARWPGGRPRIDLDYRAEIAPRGMPPLWPLAECGEAGVSLLGLELAPVYRESAGGDVYPAVLRSMRAELGHVLRQTFFSFAHTRATYRPAHYQELGPRAMTRRVHEVDQALAAISGRFDLLLHVTPVNTAQAWRSFDAQGCRRPPEFHYRPLTVDPSRLKAALYEIPVDNIADPALHHLFARKRDEMDRQITMLGDRETRRFAPESIQVYGRAGRALVEQARELLERLPAATAGSDGGAALDAAEFAARARSEVERYREQTADFAAEVEVSDAVPGILVSRGRLLIGADALVDQARVAATLHHEVGTHLLTYYNGLCQPFRQLQSGLAGYEELQEGIAVFAEYLVGGLTHRRLRLLAARVIAAESVADGADFLETFRLLEEQHAFAPRAAFNIAMRVHRSGGYTKDLIYLRGLNLLLGYLAEGGDLQELLVGKLAIDQLEIIRELRWRRVLEPPALRPLYMDDPGARARLQQAGAGLSVFDMLAAD